MTTLLPTALPAGRPAVLAPRAPAREPRLGAAWPLRLLLVGFPVWWALGLGGVACQLAAVPMAVQVVRAARAGRLRLPAGAGLWVLFLGWMLLGVSTLWALAPGTEPSTGAGRLLGFGYRVLWYAAVTVALLYPLSLPSRRVPAAQVSRWLGTLFLASVAGGLAGLVAPRFGFTSPVELLLPGARGGSGFLHTLVHPELSTASTFLGYEQPRPKAPFLYPNAWGNNVALTLPFFVHSWLTARQRWRRLAVPPLLLLAAVPITFSLNRGLWASLVVMALCASLALARAGRLAALYGVVVALVVAVVVVVASPLYATITTRLAHPHSNERRTTVAQTVVETTAKGSPLVGYGSTRTVQGNFASIAGTGTASCRSCAAPPLGTQGFVWRLVLTTGFVGTGLFAGFVLTSFLRHVRRRTPYAVLGCMSLVTGVLLSFVYDSLESPLFVIMLAVGLMNRERLEEPA